MNRLTSILATTMIAATSIAPPAGAQTAPVSIDPRFSIVSVDLLSTPTSTSEARPEIFFGPEERRIRVVLNLPLADTIPGTQSLTWLISAATMDTPSSERVVYPGFGEIYTELSDVERRQATNNISTVDDKRAHIEYFKALQTYHSGQGGPTPPAKPAGL